MSVRERDDTILPGFEVRKRIYTRIRDEPETSQTHSYSNINYILIPSPVYTYVIYTDFHQVKPGLTGDWFFLHYKTMSGVSCSSELVSRLEKIGLGKNTRINHRWSRFHEMKTCIYIRTQLNDIRGNVYAKSFVFVLDNHHFL